MAGVILDGNRRYAYLVCVKADASTVKGNNKYYQMTEKENGDIETEWGRIGCMNPSHKTYHPWEKTFDELFQTRLSHGYRDETNGHSVVKMEFKKEAFEETQEELEHLYDISRQFTKKYYSDPSHITKRQFEDAKSILELIRKDYNTISDKSTDEKVRDIETASYRSIINRHLLDIFSTAPRQMSSVHDYLLSLSPTYKELEKIINREEELLANLEVVLNQPTVEANGKTLSEAFGINMKPCTYKEEDMIKGLLHYKYEGNESWKKKQYELDNSERITRAFRVENRATHEAFEKCRKDMNISEKDCKLLFHGSDGQNFLSIMSKGMVLNADGIGLAYRTGKGLGNGLYFADDSAKALGYSSGSEKYIALFNVAVGKPYTTDVYFGDTGGITVDGKHLNRSMSFNQLPYDTQSVFYKGSTWKPRHEIVIYKQEQCDMQYLIVCEPYRQKDVRFSMHLSVPFVNLEKDGTVYKADAELSDYCKKELVKITRGTAEIKKARAEIDIESGHFSLYVNSQKLPVNLTNDEHDRLARDFKKSFFESEHDWKKDIEAQKQAVKKQPEEEIER